MPDYIIHDAKSRIESEDEAFEDIISRLEESRVTIEKEREEIQSYKDEVTRLKTRLEQKEERFDEQKDKMIRSAREDMFGDKVLIHMAEQLRRSIRGGDIAARVGGDEFLIFLEYKEEAETAIQRIFTSLEGTYEDFQISVSMGVARTDMVGTNYDKMFHAADQALYSVKRSGRGQYRFYDDTMQEMLSVISPIDGSEEKPDN